jgi:hypothetical protein
MDSMWFSALALEGTASCRVKMHRQVTLTVGIQPGKAGFPRLTLTV